ncbi:MAG TPA: FAD-dependent oxidoreductase [Gaiellaceae bacterium]|jgi:NADPH-dependent 2,4-dienoyl-CoA reductase/sulfur reductase-like enzyme|nr:FAD-dependent oxidoreductase [Gaiellaceae bacterium]
MPDYRYLIVGGGMTADAACRGIRDHDPDGSIGLVGEETEPPYSRPPLSKGLWQGKDEKTIWRGTADLGVDLHLGRRVTTLDLGGHRVTDADGVTYGYEQLLLATGGRPRRFPWDSGDDIVYYRHVGDFRKLHALAADGVEFVVIGGGFIGSEVAAGLAGTGAKVTLVFPEDAIGARLFPADLADSVNELYRSHGVEVLPGELVAGVEHDGDGSSVRLESGRTLTGAAVVAGLGIEPATELAEAAGLTVSDGIVVDEYGHAGDTGDVWAAGDVARFPAKALGTEIRVEHEDQANSHGRAVGANMAGAGKPYEHLPFFYSDLFELGYEAVGEVDSRKETVADWATPFRKGVVTYLDAERRPRGFLLVDVWGKTGDATELIAAGAPFAPEAAKGLMD